jgi:predicted RNase H-like HicB family nuclease
MRRYTVVLDPDSEGRGYTVTVPALPGCVSQGRTREEALQRCEEAIRCHIEGLAADGLPIPEETVAPTLATVAV